MKFRLLQLIGVLALAMAGGAHAACSCQCVNGQSVSLCSSSLDLPALCSAQMCPMAPVSLQPLPSMSLPPLGTQTCQQMQVRDPRTGQYEWRNICQ